MLIINRAMRPAMLIYDNINSTTQRKACSSGIIHIRADRNIAHIIGPFGLFCTNNGSFYNILYPTKEGGTLISAIIERGSRPPNIKSNLIASSYFKTLRHPVSFFSASPGIQTKVNSERVKMYF